MLSDDYLILKQGQSSMKHTAPPMIAKSTNQQKRFEIEIFKFKF